MPLAKLALQPALKIALYGGRPKAFPPPQTTAIDPVQVLTKDHFLEGFAGPLARQDPWKPLPEVAPAALALKLARLQPQHTMPQSPVLMPHSPLVAALVAQPIAPAVRAQSQPGMPRRNLDPTTADLQIGNLIIGQS